MSNICTGVNISSSRIEVAQVKKTLAGYQLLKHAAVDIENKDSPEYSLESSDKMSRELYKSRVSNVLRKVFEDNNIEPIGVVVAIPDTEIILRYFSMAYLPPKEWATAVRFEAQKYVPFRTEEVVSDFFVIDAKEKKKELKVVFIAAKKDTLGKYIDIFKDAGINVSAVEIPSLSLLRLFNSLGILSKKGVTAFLSANNKGAVLSICDNSMLYLTRDFSLSPRIQISDVFGIEQKVNLEGPSGEYENLLREIQLSFDYQYKHMPALRIEKLILLGKEEFVRWKEDLEKELKIPVTVANPNSVFKEKTNLDPLMSTAVGLSLRGFGRHERKINLSVSEETVAKGYADSEKNLLLRVVVLELILGISIMFAVNIAMSRQARIMDNNLNEVKKVRAKFKEGFANLDKQELLKIQKELSKKNVILNGIINERFYLTDQFSALPRLFPAGVWLEGVQIEVANDEKRGVKVIKLLMEGKVLAQNQKKSDIALINEFVTSLKSDPIFSSRFNKIELGFMEKAEEKGFLITRFKINCSG